MTILGSARIAGSTTSYPNWPETARPDMRTTDYTPKHTRPVPARFVFECGECETDVEVGDMISFYTPDGEWYHDECVMDILEME